MTINIELTRSEAGLLKKIMKAVFREKNYLITLKDCNGEYLVSNNESGTLFDELVLGIIGEISRKTKGVEGEFVWSEAIDGIWDDAFSDFKKNVQKRICNISSGLKEVNGDWNKKHGPGHD